MSSYVKDILCIGVMLLNLKYNKVKQNRPNGNDWGDNEKILIDINEIWISDIFEMDNEKCDASEMDNRMVKAMRGVAGS